jgi:PAS domain S-box-containing protein
MSSMPQRSAPSESAADARLIMNRIPALAWASRPDGSAEFFNQRWLDYTGLSAEEAKDWGWKVAIHPDDLLRMVEIFHKARDAARPFEAEGRLRRYDGEFRWFLFRASPLLDAAGRVEKWFGTNTDLEDRKRAEEALRAAMSERTRLDALRAEIAMTLARKDSLNGILHICVQAMVRHLDAALARIWTLTSDGRQLQLQASAGMYTRLDGRYKRIAVGELKIGLIAEERKPHLTNDVQNDPRVSDKDWARAEGMISFAGYPLVVEDRIVGVMGMFSRKVLTQSTLDTLSFIADGIARGIERTQAQRSEAYVTEAQHLSRTGSFGCKVFSGEMIWSEETFRIFGYDRTTKPGVEAILQRVHPEDKAMVQEQINRAIGQGKDCDLEYRLLMPDESVKHVHVVAHAAQDEGGGLEFIGAVMDVTEQVQARTKLEQAFAEIQLLKDQLYRENLALRDEVDRISMFEEIVGTSQALQTVLSRVIKVAPTDSSVLITGETGTGKELIARAIHKRSQRSHRGFVSVNCSALAPSLISSELFGHEKGAFTGAMQRRLGRFELADGGTIFLDEVGELPLDTQVAILRVLQERQFERVGGTQSICVDIRVIAATNCNLEAAIVKGTFRSDLFYRLNVFPIKVPPLRERKDDLLMLLEYYVHRFARKVGKQFNLIDKRTLELFKSYDWPGNIRELQNVVERSVIVSPDGVFCVDDAWLSRESTPSLSPMPDHIDEDSSRERKIIEAALTESRGRVAGPNGAAAKLGIPSSTLESRIKKLKIRKGRFKLG